MISYFYPLIGIILLSSCSQSAQMPKTPTSNSSQINTATSTATDTQTYQSQVVDYSGYSTASVTNTDAQLTAICDKCKQDFQQKLVNLGLGTTTVDPLLIVPKGLSTSTTTSTATNTNQDGGGLNGNTQTVTTTGKCYLIPSTYSANVPYYDDTLCKAYGTECDCGCQSKFKYSELATNTQTAINYFPSY